MSSELTRHHDSFHGLDHGKVGMLAFLVTEAVFFSTLVLVYIFYMEQSRPIARLVFSMPLTIVGTICLLSSSYTVHRAVQELEKNEVAAFRRWLGLTIFLGLVFLAGTAIEWKDIIFKHGVTIASDMFGTTYFTLVGFHAFHVSVGLSMLSVLLACALLYPFTTRQARPAELLSWYWHFVDGVWVVVFSVVYLIGR
jgi:cytochrome c oxidase subunit 3/cytochrome o ubiquinol oxidase subunit 3